MNHAPLTGYVAYEPEDTMVFVKLDKGKIDLSIYFSNECDDGEMMPAITAWAEDTHSTIIAPHFSVSSFVDYLIEGHRMPSLDNAIDRDSKPVFDALRSELLAEIERIDALSFMKSSS